MSKPIVIVGGGRHGRVVLDVFDGDEAVIPVAGYLDDTMPVGEKVYGYPVLNGFAAIHDRAFVLDHSWFVALGDNVVRRDLYRILANTGATIVNAIHSSAQISRRATLGRGLYIGPFASMGPGTAIGDWAIVEGHGRLGSNVRVGEAAFLGAGVTLTGESSVGDGSFLGAGTVVSNKVSVGADCVVGANSTVIRHLPDGITAAGSPAQPKPMTRRPFKR
jgi:sugar O-acyltransferase (sialic acid O-acetyltransferase NeuD family)